MKITWKQLRQLKTRKRTILRIFKISDYISYHDNKIANIDIHMFFSFGKQEWSYMNRNTIKNTI